MKTVPLFIGFQSNAFKSLVSILLIVGVMQECHARTIDGLLAVVESRKEEGGVRFIVTMKNESKQNIQIYGAKDLFGRLSVKRNGVDAWKQIGTAFVDEKPKLTNIRPGKEVMFEYFVRVKPSASEVELEMLKGGSLLGAVASLGEVLTFQYVYSFSDDGLLPWDIGFMNSKKKSVIRGVLKSNEIQVKIN